METLYFTNEEIDVLLSFIGKTSIFDVTQQSDFHAATQSLLEKGYIDIGTIPNKKTVAIVETLRIYESANSYLRFQDSVISLGENGICVLKKSISDETTDHHLFYQCNVKTMFHLLYAHPMMRYFNSHVRKIKLVPCQFVMEFYEDNTLIEYLRLEYDGTSWYSLDTYYQKDKEILETNGLQWLLDRLPDTYLEVYEDYIQEVTT